MDVSWVIESYTEGRALFDYNGAIPNSYLVTVTVTVTGGHGIFILATHPEGI